MDFLAIGSYVKTMSGTDKGSQAWLAGGFIGYNSERGPPKDHSNKTLVKIGQAVSEEKIFKHFSHRGPMLKPCQLVSANLGWRQFRGHADTILKGDHLRTIPSKFGPYWLSSFREDFLNIFSHRVLC